MQAQQPVFGQVRTSLAASGLVVDQRGPCQAPAPAPASVSPHDALCAQLLTDGSTIGVGTALMALCTQLVEDGNVAFDLLEVRQMLCHLFHLTGYLRPGRFATSPDVSIPAVL